MHKVSYGWPPKTLKFSWKSDDYSFREISETENIFGAPPFTGGPDAKILFFSTQRPPSAQKNLSRLDLPFWRYKGSKFQLFHLFPQNWVIGSPPYFAQSITGMTPKNPESERHCAKLQPQGLIKFEKHKSSSLFPTLPPPFPSRPFSFPSFPTPSSNPLLLSCHLSFLPSPLIHSLPLPSSP